MAKKKKAPAETVIVQSKCKEAIKGIDSEVQNVASDALDGLNNVVHWYIQQAVARAKANGRKTVRAHDFLV